MQRPVSLPDKTVERPRRVSRGGPYALTVASAMADSALVGARIVDPEQLGVQLLGQARSFLVSATDSALERGSSMSPRS
nr:hypothetical protein [Nitriliruptor alkaliphilus]